MFDWVGGFKRLKFKKLQVMERRDWLRLIALSGLGPVFGFQLPGNPECLTTPDILGPFYLPNSPFITKIAPDGAPGTPFFISGTVYANDCQAALKDAVVDVWQANSRRQRVVIF